MFLESNPSQTCFPLRLSSPFLDVNERSKNPSSTFTFFLPILHIYILLGISPSPKQNAPQCLFLFLSLPASAASETAYQVPGNKLFSSGPPRIHLTKARTQHTWDSFSIARNPNSWLWTLKARVGRESKPFKNKNFPQERERRLGE